MANSNILLTLISDVMDAGAGVLAGYYVYSALYSDIEDVRDYWGQ